MQLLSTTPDRGPAVFLSAKAQQVEVGSGVVCDTAPQVEKFLTIVNGDVPAVVQAVNSRTRRTPVFSDASLSFAAHRAKPSQQDGAWKIMEILVVAVATPAAFRATARRLLLGVQSR